MFAAGRGSASSERCPSARGPNSLRPWNHATTPSAASVSATSSATSSGRSNVDRRPCAASRPARRRPRRGPSAAERIGRTGSPSSAATCSAAPSAVPRRRRRAGPTPPRTGPRASSARVGDAVQRDAAGQRQARLARLLVQPARQVEQDLLQARAARWRRGRAWASVHVAAGLQRRGPARPVDRLGDEAAVARRRARGRAAPRGARAPVGRHRHDLVLVARAAEAEVRGELLVDAARASAGGRCVGERPRSRAVAQDAGQVGGALAAAVDDHHGAALPAGRREVAEAAWATWWGTKRTRPGSSPGSALARKRGARWAKSVRSPSHSSAVRSAPGCGARAGS